ncbi:hypothetical protein FE391_20770 [Nonomuraea sp. KC401]|uniref:hypothetical protein n=1 Tax=unclassified Nonomuraea TaxID=2593643 RepID=UPI0010FDB6A9|nr:MULTISPECIES: hypothetical protein [unclassified Nonomuraea]TLF70973.1 hypothetical protein FE391_20770 [Nonomuraea sp. KC401]
MTVVALALSLVVGGCAEQREEVDPAVRGEVGKIGTIVWKQRYEGVEGTATVVTDSFVIDVGGKTEVASFKKAVAFLRSRGWVTTADGSPYRISMHSPKWKGSNLAVYALRAAQEFDRPEVKKALEKEGAKLEALVSVVAYVGW